MYVCVCNAVTDSEIREAYADGARTFEALQDELAVSTCCGCCEPMVRDIVATCRAEDRTPVAPVRTPLPAMAALAMPQPG